MGNKKGKRQVKTSRKFWSRRLN